MDFYGLLKVKRDADRRSRYDKEKDIRFKRTLRDSLNIRELVYSLAERLRKIDAPGRLHKSTADNNKDQIF